MRTLALLLLLAACGEPVVDEASDPGAATAEPAERAPGRPGPTLPPEVVRAVESAGPDPIVPPTLVVDVPEVTDPARRRPVSGRALVPPVLDVTPAPSGATRPQPPASDRPLVPPTITLP